MPRLGGKALLLSGNQNGKAHFWESISWLGVEGLEWLYLRMLKEHMFFLKIIYIFVIFVTWYLDLGLFGGRKD